MHPCRFFEALRDPKGYLFMLFATIGCFVGGAGIQYSLIIKDFGFNIMQTTLLNIPGGSCQVIAVTFWMWMLRKYPVSKRLVLIRH
jgi:hypothetical protein